MKSNEAIPKNKEKKIAVNARSIGIAVMLSQSVRC